MIDPRVKLGEGVVIGPFAQIIGEVTIGDRTMIGPKVVIEGPAVIGSDNRIYTAAILGRSLEPDNETDAHNRLVIGDENVIREYVTLTAGGGESGPTSIGNGSLIMMQVQVGRGVHIGDHVQITNATEIGPGTKIADRAYIGGLSVIDAGIRIGSMVMVGAKSRIQHDVPPFMLAAGNPAHTMGLNIVGLRRNGVGGPERIMLQRAYKMLYRQELTPDEAREKIKESLAPIPEIQHLLSFIEQSNGHL